MRELLAGGPRDTLEPEEATMEEMRCDACGRANEDDAKFCDRCGAQIAARSHPRPAGRLAPLMYDLGSAELPTRELAELVQVRLCQYVLALSLGVSVGVAIFVGTVAPGRLAIFAGASSAAALAVVVALIRVAQRGATERVAAELERRRKEGIPVAALSRAYVTLAAPASLVASVACAMLAARFALGA